MMISNPSKLIVVGCSLISLLLCAVGIVTLSWYKKTTECFKDRPPLRSFVLTINRSQQKLLVAQSQKFADQHGFELNVVYYTPNGQEFLIDMTRTDVELTVSNPSSANLDLFYVYFYNYDCIHPTVASDVGDLVDDLQSLLSEIPNITITEEK